MISGIYVIINTITAYAYVGNSKNIEERWKQHKWVLARNEHPNKWLQRDWNKYGKNSFVLSIVKFGKCSNDDEMQAILKYQPKCYNMGTPTKGNSEKMRFHVTRNYRNWVVPEPEQS